MLYGKSLLFNNLTGPIVYAIAWAFFGLLHSLLAREFIQFKLETCLGAYYRFTYNVFAACKIMLVFYIGSIWLSDDTFILLNNNGAFITSSILRFSGMVVFLLALSMYDLGRFSGITQVITGEKLSSSSDEPLQRRFLNRLMRHPLYTAAFLLLWGGAVSPLGLWTAVWGTLYLIIGTFFEERKLVRIYGDEYRRYQQEVPRYFPGIAFSK